MSTLLVLLVLTQPPPPMPGRALFLEHCSICHGEDGDGHGPVAPTLPLPPRNFRREPLQWGNSQRSVVDTVTRGRQGVMPDFADVLSAKQIEEVAAYVWSIIPSESKKRSAVGPPLVRSTKGRVFLVHQRNKQFTPKSITARVGDALVFVNEDVVEHEVHALERESPPIQSQKPKQWDRVELTSEGTLKFGCAIHPAMRLEVKVEVEVKPAIEVRQKGQRFSSAEVTVPRGGSVLFVNDDDVMHTVYSREGRFTLPAQQPGERSSATFSEVGTYEVRCAIHPGMKLKVRVKE